MKKALQPVRNRLRLRRAAACFWYGLLAAILLALLLMAASFLTPLRLRNIGLLCCAALPFPAALAAYCWPVSPLAAAKAADACGLQERAQTALALQGRQDEMAKLQRQDALRALQSLDTRKALPVRLPRRLALICCGGAALLLALCFVPNRQDDALRAQDQFAAQMEKPAKALEEAAAQLNDGALDPKTAQDLRKLLGDLTRDLRKSRDSREALTALSQAQQRMEKLLADPRAAARDALAQAGLDALSQALEAGDRAALEQAMEQAAAQDAGQLADQLNQAAQASANVAASSALQAAANALASGSSAKAAQALGQLSPSSLSSGALAAALQSAKTMASSQGQGQGQGQGAGQGKGAGSGAGQGSTNEDMSGSAQAGNHTSGGKAPASYKLGQYESIYDPTRLGDGGEISHSTGPVDENAQISEMTLGPGLGDASGDVPYDQVVGQYQSAAVQRAQEAALPGYAQQWVADYFSALTE